MSDISGEPWSSYYQAFVSLERDFHDENAVPTPLDTYHSRCNFGSTLSETLLVFLLYNCSYMNGTVVVTLTTPLQPAKKISAIWHVFARNSVVTKNWGFRNKAIKISLNCLLPRTVNDAVKSIHPTLLYSCILSCYIFFFAAIAPDTATFGKVGYMKILPGVMAHWTSLFQGNELIPTDQWFHGFMSAPFITKLFVVHFNFHFEFTIEHALTIMAYTGLSVRGCISPPATCASGDTSFCVECETFGCVSWLCTDNRWNAVGVACLLPVLSWESEI